MTRYAAIASTLVLAFWPAPPAGAASGWTWPLAGEVITGYRNGDDPYAGGQHRGIDIAAREGEAVAAAVEGTVHFAGVAGSSGLTVAVKTADGRFDTSYLHLSSIAVRRGDRVLAGARIGAAGRTGRRSAERTHLHFGVREADSRHAYRNPLNFLPPRPVPVPDAPRGAPAPVGVPVWAAPRAEPVRSPRGVPRGHRVSAPTGRRTPAPGPARRRAPLPGPAPSPLPRVRPSPVRAPARAPAPSGAPALGPAPRPLPAPHQAGNPTRPAGSQPYAPSASAAGGPDLGWALACLGLLLAAGCLGRPGRRASGERRRGSAAVAALLRPLIGRG